MLVDQHDRVRPSLGVRALGSLMLALLLVPLAGLTTTVVSAPALPEVKAPKLTEAQKTFVRELDVTEGRRLRLLIDTGAEIQVTGWDEPRVRVQVGLGGRDWEQTGVVVEPDEGGVRVRMNHAQRGSYSTSHWIQIQVPRRFDIQLASSAGGLVITGVSGTFKGNTGGGAFVLTNLTGRAELNTGGGDIAVTDSTLDGWVNTGGGSVKVLRVKGAFRANSGGGPVIYDQHESGPIELNQGGGDIELTEAMRGATVNTGGGNIDIGRAAGFVSAQTGGGDIDIGPVAGSVRANTGAGNVHVELVDAKGQAQTVEISSGTGEVALELPDSFTGTFDLETSYTQNHGREVRIDTGWKMPIELSDWDDSEGSPRRYVRARGKVGNGSGRIKVRTVNGDISIKVR